MRWSAVLRALFASTLLAAGGADARDLYPGREYAAGEFPTGLAVADLDGDAVPDAVTADQNGDDVRVFRGNGDGTFEAAVSFPSGAGPAAVAVADLDGDGQPDLVTANRDGGGVSVLRGNGDGTFQPAVSFAADTALSPSVSVADLDGDAVPDLVVGGDGVSVLLGNGDGSFRSAVSLPDSGGLFVVVADLDRDTIPDLVTAGSALLGNGDGSFQAAISYPGDVALAVAVADVDGDTVADLVASYQGSPSFPVPGGARVLLGNGDGSFRPPGEFFATGFPSFSIALADLDGDGDADLVAASATGGGEVSVLVGNGDGSFQTAISYAAAGSPPIGIPAIALADIDRDGLPDLVSVSTRILPFPSGGALFIGTLHAFLGTGDGTLHAPLLLPVGDYPVDSVAVGDLDGDTVPDIVAASASDRKVGVLLGDGDRSFEPARLYPLSGSDPLAGPFLVAVADLDGDTLLDILAVTGRRFINELSVQLGNGDGSFQPAVFFPAAPGLTLIAVADLDGDGNVDVVGRHSSFLSVVLGNGDGSFRPPLEVAAGASPRSIAVAHLDGDAFPDLVTTSQGSGGVVRVLLGNGDGSFQPALAFPVGSPNPGGAVAVADLDGDAVLDLVAPYMTSSSAGGLSVLRGNGDGSFQPALAFPITGGASVVAVADVDGDDVPDLVTRADSRVVVLLGNGDATFREALFHGIGSTVRSFAVADLDGDGLPDLVAGTVNRNAVTVAFHLDAPPLPVALDIKPGPGANVVNPKSRGVIPVAILGSEDFDVAEIDAKTLAFGPTGARPAHQKGGHREDVNGDGFPDLVSHYRTKEAGIAFGDTQMCVTGELHDGTRIEGCDSIATVGARGAAPRRSRGSPARARSG